MVELSGSQVSMFNFGNGLTITPGNSVVRGLALDNWTRGSGIYIDGGDSNTIGGNYIGLDRNGAAAGNLIGITILNSDDNLIGGSTLASRNVISANVIYGVFLECLGGFGVSIDAARNGIKGNYIGTNSAGTAALGNGGGIAISTSPSNAASADVVETAIGGAQAGEGNLISGNGTGIDIGSGGPTDSSRVRRTQIQGNLIGTNISGDRGARFTAARHCHFRSDRHAYRWANAGGPERDIR